MVGIVAWLLLAAGYIFLQSALLQEHLQRIEGQMAERVDRLTRELATLRRGQSERLVTTHLATAPSSSSAASNPIAAP